MIFLMLFLTFNLSFAQSINSQPEQKKFLEQYLEGCLKNLKRHQTTSHHNPSPGVLKSLDILSQKECSCLIDHEAKNFKLPDFEAQDSPESYFKKGHDFLTKARYLDKGNTYLEECQQVAVLESGIKKQYIEQTQQKHQELCEQSPPVLLYLKHAKGFPAREKFDPKKDYCACYIKDEWEIVYKILGNYEDKKVGSIDFPLKISVATGAEEVWEKRKERQFNCWQSFSKKVKAAGLSVPFIESLEPKIAAAKMIVTQESVIKTIKSEYAKQCTDRALKQHGNFLKALEYQGIKHFNDSTMMECACYADIFFAQDRLPLFEDQKDTEASYKDKVFLFKSPKTGSSEDKDQLLLCHERSTTDSGLKEHYLDYVLATVKVGIKGLVPDDKDNQVSNCVLNILKGDFYIANGGPEKVKGLKMLDLENKISEMMSSKLKNKADYEAAIAPCKLKK